MREKYGRRPRDTRRDWNERAWIAMPGTFAIRECRILDLSASGAKLSIASAERLPHVFHLVSSPSSREGRKCELRWRDGSQVGVKFTT